MAFARLFPIDATDAQDGDRTFSETYCLQDDACGSPARADRSGRRALSIDAITWLKMLLRAPFMMARRKLG
jgi:hypothetical protein